jgi:hypothetical protein
MKWNLFKKHESDMHFASGVDTTAWIAGHAL